MEAKNTPENKFNFTKYWQTCKIAPPEFHVNKIKAIFNTKNIKHFYDYVNRKLGRAKLSVMLEDDNGIVLTDTVSAEMFAKFFQSVFFN